MRPLITSFVLAVVSASLIMLLNHGDAMLRAVYHGRTASRLLSVSSCYSQPQSTLSQTAPAAHSNGSFPRKSPW